AGSPTRRCLVQMQEYDQTTPAMNPPPPPAPVQEPRHGLARYVLPLIAVAIGLLGMADLAGVRVAPSAYVALPLAIGGLGQGHEVVHVAAIDGGANRPEL